MNEIICPNCKKAFQVDEAGFANILKQVRDTQFEVEIKSRLNLAEKEKEAAILLAEAKVTSALQEKLSKKEQELADLKAKNDKAELEKQLSVAEAVKKIEKERDDLANKIQNKDLEKKLLESSLQEKFNADLR
jgi:hypothetical protein